ncbi:hypothetical protein [Membranihabitans marinus]|uniref:hypothetical protein n=1 Tax=Membranihabitans marinus TaxID=1227546 RepID=UPI001F2A4F79|nr:hypothetical protein [Membranihabitans marinus]
MMWLKNKIILSALAVLLSQICFSQNKDSDFYFNEYFSSLVKKVGLNIEIDSLKGYVLSNQNQLFGNEWDLVLTHAGEQNIVYVKYHPNSNHPPIHFSHLVTNVMENTESNSTAFYTLDPIFIATVLHANWANDARFKPKEYENHTAYARSFYNETRQDQITILLIGKDIPYLSTPKEIQAFKFQPVE